jgi:hypothetical protein
MNFFYSIFSLIFPQTLANIQTFNHLQYNPFYLSLHDYEKQARHSLISSTLEKSAGKPVFPVILFALFNKGGPYRAPARRDKEGRCRP